MYIKYIEGTLDEIKEEIGSDILNNLYVRIGEKVQVGSTLCEVIDIVHYPEKYNQEKYSVDVYVKVLKKLPESSFGASIARLRTVLVALSF